jgi:hypothetical protein
MEKETLEEAAEKYIRNDASEEARIAIPLLVNKCVEHLSHIFIAGAKWEKENSNVNALHFEIDALKRLVKVLEHQQERMYSEEDMIAFGKFCHNDAHSSTYFSTFNLLLQQFKKK